MDDAFLAEMSQARIRIETAAITLIFERFDAKVWQHVSSEMARIEIGAIADAERQNRVRMLLPETKSITKLKEAIFKRAEQLEAIGFKAADAVHIAAAEGSHADVFLSCDDRLCRLAKRRRGELRVPVANPALWLKERKDADA